MRKKFYLKKINRIIIYNLNSLIIDNVISNFKYFNRFLNIFDLLEIKL